MYLIQTLVLMAGSIFAWFTVYTDFARFYNIYGNLTRINDCLIPNPVTTPCFYGAFAFLGAFIWSIIILKTKKELRFNSQKKLNILLIASTVFAWSNLTLEIVKFSMNKTGSQVSCSGVPTSSIFVTPCFIGSMIFLSALIVALVINYQNRGKFKITNNE